MQKLLNFLFEIEFFIKVTIGCMILQQIFSGILHNLKLNYISQVVLLWSLGSVSFYAIGILIEIIIKKNYKFSTQRNIRIKKVKKQAFPKFTITGIIYGEIKSLIAVAVILYLAPEVHRGNDIFLNFGWFLMRIIIADLCFYLAHWLLHRRWLQKIHFKHHQFADSSSFVAGHKSLAEYIIVTITDLLPIFIFGYDITQLLAWTVIGNAYNLEGHSSLSLFFISSDFHDLHHTYFRGNYGIQGFWDRIFKTLNTPTKKPGLMFPIVSLEKMIANLSTTKSEKILTEK